MRRFSSPEQRGSWFIALFLSLTVLLAACGGSATPTTAPTATDLPVTATIAAAAPTATDLPATPTPAPTMAPAASAPPVAPAAITTATPPPSAATMPPPTATVPPPTATIAPPTATPVPRAGQPTRVKIPIIRVDAAIEYVGLTAAGAMDVPKNYNNTAWYEPGPRPGEQGNAVIAGHVDSKTSPAVFWNLPKLKPGDEIFVTGDDGVERRFIVVALEAYKRTDAPLQRIFGPTTDRHLNLITCDVESGFDRTKGEYGGNLVVYAELAP